MDPFIGQLIMFGGNFAPRGWALCDGQLLPISSNSALFSILGTTYGGDGRTTFALPDLRGRVPVHAGNGPGLTDKRLGSKGGAETTTLITQNLPAHHHQLIASSQPAAQAGASGGYFPSNGRGGDLLYASSQGTATSMGETTGNTGNNTSFNNMQPYVTVNYIIALVGTFPSRS